MLRRNDTVLIDAPDYSKTDRRLMTKDLEEIYWLWNTLASLQSMTSTSAILVKSP